MRRFNGETIRYGQKKKEKTEADIDNDIKELNLKKHRIIQGKNEFIDMGESVGRNNLQSKSVEYHEDEKPLKEKHIGKKFKTKDDLVYDQKFYGDESHETESKDETKDYSNEKKIDELRRKIIEQGESRIDYSPTGGAATFSIATPEDTNISKKLDFTSDELLSQPDYETEYTSHDIDDLRKLRDRIKAGIASEKEKKIYEIRMHNFRGTIGGKYDPGDNLKTMSASKKQRLFRGLLGKIIGKIPWVKGEKHQKHTEKLENEENFYNQDIFDIVDDEEKEHPMYKHWKEDD
jgi:hypothetical protein